MNVDKLMRRFDRLDHHERMVDVAEYVCKLEEKEIQALGQALMQGDVHRRLLALHVAAISRDANAALAALDDPSLSVRHQAALLTGRLAESLPADLLDRIDASSLSRLLAEVVRRRRRGLALQLCEGLCARERLAEASQLLTLCPPAWIAERLDSIAWPDGAWLRLAKQQTDMLCDRIELQFNASERPEQVFARYGADVWARLCKARPQRIVEWIDRHVSRDEFPFALVQGIERLCISLPERVVAYLVARPAWLARIGVPRALVTRARLLDDDVLAPLCRLLAQAQPATLAKVLSQLPYPRRAELFARATAEIEMARIEWPLVLLAALPGALADREAARMLGLQRASTDGSWRRQLLGYRAIADARPLLEKECQSAQAEERGEALAALITASARAATGLGETLAYLQRSKNDQDPVRMAVIQALALVPAHRFDDAAALDLVISPIFDARDTSWATRQAAARVAHKLLIAHALTPTSPMFALGLSLLERLAGHQGTPDLPRLDTNLPRGAEQAIVDALLPWVRAAQSRQQEHHPFRLWSRARQACVAGARAVDVDGPHHMARAEDQRSVCSGAVVGEPRDSRRADARVGPQGSLGALPHAGVQPLPCASADAALRSHGSQGAARALS